MAESALLDYSGIATGVRGLGPGSRVVLWVRGCTIGCAGCMTSDLWAKGEPRPITRLADELEKHLQSSDGLTISGGEPFQQPREVAALIRSLRARLEFNVLVYSGYVWEHLVKNADAADLLRCIDVLMDGPFKAEESNLKTWRGSDNQRAIVLSERGSVMTGFDNMYDGQRELQLQTLQDGRVRIIGIPRRNDMDALKILVGKRGLAVAEGKKPLAS